MHGTYRHALAAVDTGRAHHFFGLFGVLFRKHQNRRGVFHDDGVIVPLGGTHHRAAAYHARDVVLHAAAEGKHVLIGGSERHTDVFRLVNRVAVHRDHALDERHTGGKCVMHGSGGFGVEDDTADVSRQLSGGKLFAGKGVNELAFVALRIFGL